MLTYTYEASSGEPDRPRSARHTGAGEFHLVGLTPSRMTGTYWTDRFTVGGIELQYLGSRTDYVDYGEVAAALSQSDR